MGLHRRCLRYPLRMVVRLAPRPKGMPCPPLGLMMPCSTRSTPSRSVTPTVMASATSRASSRSSTTCMTSASMPSGSIRASSLPFETRATTSPTTFAAPRATGPTMTSGASWPRSTPAGCTSFSTSFPDTRRSITPGSRPRCEPMPTSSPTVTSGRTASGSRPREWPASRASRRGTVRAR